MEKSFYFVEGIGADRKAKRGMRQHVMKGKNLGRRLNRASKTNKMGGHVSVAGTDTTSNFSYLELEYGWGVGQGPGQPFGNFVAMVSLPVDITPHMVQVMGTFFSYVSQRMYPARMGISSQDVIVGWLRLMAQDEEACQCNISLMQVCNELFLDNGHTSPVALRYLERAFALVNRRIHGQKALSDATIAIILTLISQEQMRQGRAAAEIHRLGLAKVVALRGGMQRLRDESAVSLVIKISKMDVLFALQYGGPTILFVDMMDRARQTLQPLGLSVDGHGREQLGLHPRLSQVLRDVLGLCALFNSGLRGQRVPAHAFAQMVLSVFGRLLQFRQFSAEPILDKGVDAVYHVGLTVFMMTVFLQWGETRMIRYDVVSAQLEALATLDGLDVDDKCALWLLVVGSIWLDDCHSLSSKLQIVASRLGIRTWGDARATLTQFPWLSAIHDTPGSRIWDRTF